MRLPKTLSLSILLLFATTGFAQIFTEVKKQSRRIELIAIALAGQLIFLEIMQLSDLTGMILLHLTQIWDQLTSSKKKV